MCIVHVCGAAPSCPLIPLLSSSFESSSSRFSAKKKSIAMAGVEQPPCKAALGRASPSFRLHSTSLNAIRLRRVFDLFDHNGDGEITLAELRQALARLGLEVDAEDLRSAVSDFIRAGRAGLSFEDFEGLHRSLGDALFGDLGDVEAAGAAAEAADESDLAEAFSVFDENGDGFISARELQTVLGKLGLAEGGDIARVHVMICSVDRDHDGRVNFSEFKEMMRGITVRSS